MNYNQIQPKAMINQKSYQHQQKHQMKLILALIIITNKLMNGFQKNQNHLEMKLGWKHIAPILKQYDKETIINKIIRYYELSPTKYNKAATEQLIKLSDTYLADELELIVKVKKENNKSELGFALTNNNESTFGSN
jgi:hypothetical protein